MQSTSGPGVQTCRPVGSSVSVCPGNAPPYEPHLQTKDIKDHPTPMGPLHPTHTAPHLAQHLCWWRKGLAIELGVQHHSSRARMEAQTRQEGPCNTGTLPILPAQTAACNQHPPRSCGQAHPGPKEGSRMAPWVKQLFLPTKASALKRSCAQPPPA